MRVLKYFINLVLLFVIIIFFIENSEQLSRRVQFKFDLFMPGFLWQMPELPLYFLLIVFFSLGGLITAAIFAWGRIGVTRRLSQAKRRIRGLEKEVTAYRKLPLAGPELLKPELLKKEEPRNATLFDNNDTDPAGPQGA